MSRDVPFLVVLQTNCSINWASPYLQASALLCSAWDSLGPRNNHKYTNLCNWVALFLPPPPPPSPPLCPLWRLPFRFPMQMCKGSTSERGTFFIFSSGPLSWSWSDPKNMQPIFMTMRNNWPSPPPPPPPWPCHQSNPPRPGSCLICLSGRGLKRRPHIASWVTDCPQIEQQINTIPNWRLTPKTVNYLRPSKTHTHRDSLIKTSEFRDQIYL